MNPYLNIKFDIPSYRGFIYRHQILGGCIWPEAGSDEPIVRAEIIEEIPPSPFDSTDLVRRNAFRCIIHLFFDDWLYPVPMIGVKWIVSMRGRLHLDNEKHIKTEVIRQNFTGVPIKNLPLPLSTRKAELLLREAPADKLLEPPVYGWPNWNEWLYLDAGTWIFSDKIFLSVMEVYRKWIPTVPINILYYEVKTFGQSMPPFRPITKPSSRPGGGHLRLIGKDIFYTWVEYENRPIFAVEDIENIVFYDAHEAVMAAYAELNNKYINIEGRNLESENIYIEKFISLLEEQVKKITNLNR